ncbi:GATA zinc finger domain-containing protein 14-like [Ruditapes philippinarum]|uniref:GATA zinc finger domain-containing protein 14-like n=1 Tax=Ruditapes philippinarum TaxID=129788 RepID=UPI00295BDBDD|nr:GATA zinc finger domain-containing protein 14-like [Ruditapes philippinarum]
MELLNYLILLVVLNLCPAAVARKGSQSNHQLLQRLENLESSQRFNTNKITRLEHDFNAQTSTIEEQKKAIHHLEGTVRQLTATLDRTNRLARRNRRKYSSIRSFILNKGLKEWTDMNTKNNQKSQLSSSHNHKKSNDNHHKAYKNHDKELIASNINLHGQYSKNRKSNKSSYHQHNQHQTESLSTINNRNNNKTSGGHSYHHNHHVNHKSNKTNTHHNSNHQHHKSDDSSSHGQSRKQNHRMDSNKHTGHSNHRNQNKNSHDHKVNGHIGKETHHIKTSTNAHANKSKTLVSNGPLLSGSNSAYRHASHSKHTNVTEINSNDFEDTHGSRIDHEQQKKPDFSNRKNHDENQKTRHLKSNETPERRRNLVSPRQSFGGIAFSVYLDHDATISQHETVKFNKIITNDGGGYSAQTGVFTCSEGGVYMFTFSIGQRDQDHYMWAELMVNSMNMIDAVVDTYHPSQDLQGGNTVIVRLKQGDRVWIDATHNGSHLEGSGSLRLTTFSGLFLYA